MQRLLSEAERRLLRKRLWDECNRRKDLPRKARLTLMESIWLHWLDDFYAGKFEGGDAQAPSVAEGPQGQIAP